MRSLWVNVNVSALAESPDTRLAACAGHWTPHQPIAKGKGVFFNDLVEADAAHTDPLTLTQDICLKAKIYKA